ncbi:uncharacterized protein LOC135391866 isoform X2 [Ornithodoros turicata]
MVFWRKTETIDAATETEPYLFPLVNLTSSVSAASTAGTTRALPPATTRAPSTTPTTMTTATTETTMMTTTAETTTIITTTPDCDIFDVRPTALCNETTLLKPTTYTITSPGYGAGHYNSNLCYRECFHAYGCFLRINTISFNMEPRGPTGVCKDYFELRNTGIGIPGSGAHIGPVCGTEGVSSDVGQGGMIVTLFHSNEKIEEAGYKLEFVFYAKPPEECGYSRVAARRQRSVPHRNSPARLTGNGNDEAVFNA